MGRKYKYNQFHQEEGERKIQESLRASTRRIKITEKNEYSGQYNSIIRMLEAYKDYYINDPKNWINRHRTDNLKRLTISMVRYTFGKYKVPVFLENEWIKFNTTGHGLFIPNNIPSTIDFKLWYLCVAQGRSLYKDFARRYNLTRMDVHHFLDCPYDEVDPQTAMWYGIAVSRGANSKLSTMIMRSKISKRALNDEFFKSVVLWLVNNIPEDLNCLNDMYDYLVHRYDETDGKFSMKGRTLESIMKNVKDWHYELRRMKNIGGGNWEGMPIHNTDIKVGTDEETQIWHFKQIKTGDGLANEGNKMHHCVWSYKQQCIEGRTFIWSAGMTYKNKTKDYLTIEVNLVLNKYEIVQVRGFANRSPNDYEKHMVKTWATQEGLSIRSFNYW